MSACLYIAGGVCLFRFFFFPRLNLGARGSAQVDGEHILQFEKAIITWGLGLIFFLFFHPSFLSFKWERLFWLLLDMIVRYYVCTECGCGRGLPAGAV